MAAFFIVCRGSSPLPGCSDTINDRWQPIYRTGQAGDASKPAFRYALHRWQDAIGNGSCCSAWRWSQKKAQACSIDVSDLPMIAKTAGLCCSDDGERARPRDKPLHGQSSI